MPNSVIINHALSGETVKQGFTADGVYTAEFDNTEITVEFNGTAKSKLFPIGTSKNWEIEFDDDTPEPGEDDLKVTIEGAGASNDQSDDVVVVDGNPPLGLPALSSPPGVRVTVFPVPAGVYTVSGNVQDTNGILVVCMVQRMALKSKQARTLFCATAQVVNEAWTTLIRIPNAPGGNKRLVLRALLINRNSRVIGTVTLPL